MKMRETIKPFLVIFLSYSILICQIKTDPNFESIQVEISSSRYQYFSKNSVGLLYTPIKIKSDETPN